MTIIHEMALSTHFRIKKPEPSTGAHQETEKGWDAFGHLCAARRSERQPGSGRKPTQHMMPDARSGGKSVIDNGAQGLYIHKDICGRSSRACGLRRNDERFLLEGPTGEPYDFEVKECLFT